MDSLKNLFGGARQCLCVRRGYVVDVFKSVGSGLNEGHHHFEGIFVFLARFAFAWKSFLEKVDKILLDSFGFVNGALQFPYSWGHGGDVRGTQGPRKTQVYDRTGGAFFLRDCTQWGLEFENIIFKC